MTTPTDTEKLAQALREIIDADMQPVCCNRPERHPDTGEPLGCCGSPEPEPGPCAQIAIAALVAHGSRAQPASEQIFEAYKTWPADIRRKLSLHDLRRMTGWTPNKYPDGWEIDTSTGTPILTHGRCSVIQDDEALYVMGLIENAAQPASVAAAEQLCKIYFEIAAECIGEEDVRRRRDERIAMLAATAPQPAKET